MSVNAWYEEIVIPAPAAGANIIRRVPGETFEYYHTVRFTLVTDAVAGNRGVYLAWQDGDGNEYMRVAAGLVQAASTTVIYTFAREMDTNAPTGPNENVEPLPLVTIPSGHFIVISSINLDAADQFSLARIWAKRTPTGPMAPATGASAFDPLEWGVA